MATTLKLAFGGGSSLIRIASGLLPEACDLARGAGDRRPSAVAFVTDRNVDRHHGAAARAALAPLAPLALDVVLAAGEATKNAAVLMDLLAKMARAGLDRGSLVVALGGGMVLDLAGFAAAVYMRGIDFLSLPTSLLAQVDAAIGGKTAIDLPEGKNLVGAFHLPGVVAVDPELLATLPGREWRNGLAEVVKYGVLDRADLLDRLEAMEPSDLLRSGPAVEEIIARCVGLKVAICSRDGRERGERMLLNLGHTIGHALEAAAGFANLAHGEAVAIGMVAEAELAERLGLAPAGAQGLGNRLRALLRRLGLPVAAPALDREAVLAFLGADKKKRGRQLRFALPLAAGRVEVVDVAWGGELEASVAAALGG